MSQALFQKGKNKKDRSGAAKTGRVRTGAKGRVQGIHLSLVATELMVGVALFFP